MSHWEAVAIAYGVSALAIVVELLLLRRRRQRALRQLKESQS
jgi:heme exporter protein CcmD